MKCKVVKTSLNFSLSLTLPVLPFEMEEVVISKCVTPLTSVFSAIYDATFYNKRVILKKFLRNTINGSDFVEFLEDFYRELGGVPLFEFLSQGILY